MSYLPAIANEVWDTRQTVTTLSSRMPTTHVLPVSPYVNHATQTTNHSNGSQIFMNHPLLPPMEDFDLLGNTLNGHAIGKDWIYTCWGQPSEGIFYLRDAPGVFVIGAQRWSTDVNAANDYGFRYTITLTNGSNMYTHTLKGTEQLTLSLSTGDYFWLTYSYDSNIQSQDYEDVEINADSRFMLTRLSHV